MPTFSPKPTSTYTPAPKGAQMARCYQFIEIGTVQEEYLGKPRMQRKIQLGFELPLKKKVFREGEPERPISVFKEFTLSMGEKSNLRKLVEGIIGTTLIDEEAFAFDIESLVGMSCILNIVHKTSAKGKVRDDIASASPLMDGMNCPAAINPPRVLTYENWNQEVYDSLPNFIKEKMAESEQMKKRNGLPTNGAYAAQKADKELDEYPAPEPASPEDINPDDIPFN